MRQVSKKVKAVKLVSYLQVLIIPLSIILILVLPKSLASASKLELDPLSGEWTGKMYFSDGSFDDLLLSIGPVSKNNQWSGTLHMRNHQDGTEESGYPMSVDVTYGQSGPHSVSFGSGLFSYLFEGTVADKEIKNGHWWLADKPPRPEGSFELTKVEPI